MSTLNVTTILDFSSFSPLVEMLRDLSLADIMTMEEVLGIGVF